MISTQIIEVAMHKIHETNKDILETCNIVYPETPNYEAGISIFIAHLDMASVIISAIIDDETREQELIHQWLASRYKKSSPSAPTTTSPLEASKSTEKNFLQQVSAENDTLAEDIANLMPPSPL
jgi:hypothetical protein